MHTVFALLCFAVVIHWLIFPYPSGLLHWHCGNLTIAPVPAKQPWWIWINTSCEFIMNDCITTTKQSTTKPCAYFLGYTVVSERVVTPSQKTICIWRIKTPLHPHSSWLGLALLTLSWDKNWYSHSLVNGYPSFYPRIALVAPSPDWCTYFAFVFVSLKLHFREICRTKYFCNTVTQVIIQPKPILRCLLQLKPLWC